MKSKNAGTAKKRGKRRTSRSQTTAPSNRPLRVRWKDEPNPGGTGRRFYQMETLASATEALLKRSDSFMLTAIRASIGPSFLSTVSLDLISENRYALLFQLRATNAKRKRVTFRFIAAKNAEEHSESLKAEYSALKRIHTRTPRVVIRPLCAGALFLPDRYRRKTGDREIFAYLTEETRGFHPLGMAASGQFTITLPPDKRCTNKETQALKRRLIETILRTFDPRKRDLIAVPNLSEGNLLATRPSTRPMQLKIVGCPRLVTNASPGPILRSLLNASWKIGRASVPVVPDDPAEIIQALTNVFGKDEALRWLDIYYRGLTAGRFKKSRHLPVDLIAQKLGKN